LKIITAPLRHRIHEQEPVYLDCDTRSARANQP